LFSTQWIVVMKTKSYLVQDDCHRIMDAAVAHARAKNWAVSICICDDGGHILRVERLDGAPPFTAQMAVARRPRQPSGAASPKASKMSSTRAARHW